LGEGAAGGGDGGGGGSDARDDFVHAAPVSGGTSNSSGVTLRLGCAERSRTSVSGRSALAIALAASA